MFHVLKIFKIRNQLFWKACSITLVFFRTWRTMNYPALFLSTDSIQNVFSSSSKKVQSLPPLQSQYECEECDYKTTKKELMRQHKLVKHTRTANKCSACSYTHYYKCQVRKHFNQVHLNIKRKCKIQFQ